ncbi:AAEL000989-PA [Aedes aegypti]|uniref:AAEL000989-PA n=1 Tax=Aedes aegypti TaxID=7159 RepID=Q17MM0_AEDAE|nr:AAEL000989-PA [Aedes aegypti]
MLSSTKSNPAGESWNPFGLADPRLPLGQVLVCDVLLSFVLLCSINVICILHLLHNRVDACPAVGRNR